MAPDAALATPADLPAVAGILTAGFADDPVLSWVFDDTPSALRPFFEFLLTAAFLPAGATWFAPGCVAAWTPGQPELSEERVLQLGALLGRICSTEDVRRLGVMTETLSPRHPTEPHWYLGLLATEPAVQGRGHGTALLARTLERVDAQALPAYLESTNPRNVSLYLRHGFAVLEELHLEGSGPLVTTMWRPVTTAPQTRSAPSRTS